MCSSWLKLYSKNAIIIRWQVTVFELLNIEMGFCSIQSLSWKKKKNWLRKWERSSSSLGPVANAKDVPQP